MAEELSDAELDQIEQRAARAFAVAPQPWVSLLETRYGIGGGSFVRFGGGPNDDNDPKGAAKGRRRRVQQPGHDSSSHSWSAR
jgi:hypothetical protein